MKRVTIVVIIALCLAMSACGAANVAGPSQEAPAATATNTAAPPQTPEESPSEEPSEIVIAATESALQSVYDKMTLSGLMPEMIPLPESMVLDYYGFDKADYTDAVFYISFDSMIADEIVLVAAKDEASAVKVEEMLNTRLEAKAEEARGYSPEQYAIIKKCSIKRNGNNVALIVGPNEKDLTGIYMDYINTL